MIDHILIPSLDLEADHFGHDEAADAHPYQATKAGYDQAIILEEAIDIARVDPPDHGEHDDIEGIKREKRKSRREQMQHAHEELIEQQPGIDQKQANLSADRCHEDSDNPHRPHKHQADCARVKVETRQRECRRGDRSVTASRRADNWSKTRCFSPSLCHST